MYIDNKTPVVDKTLLMVIYIYLNYMRICICHMSMYV